MCGIAGIRRFEDTPINAEEIKILLQSLEHRGRHATGIALMTEHDEIKIIKAPQPAWAFCAEKSTEEFLDAFLPGATMALLHVRAATVGNPEFNQNNHPMFMGRSAVIHNGTINNHDMMFKELKADRSADTDSDVFRATLDSEGITESAIKFMNKFNGSAAIAAFSQAEPDKLLLARSGSPLVYGITPDKLWWASEIQAIQRAVRPWVHNHGLYARQFRSDVAYNSMPDNTAYILTPNGMNGRYPFKTCFNYHAPDYGKMRTDFHSKTTTWKKEAKAKRLMTITVPVTTPSTPKTKTKATICPKCKAWTEIPYADKWHEYICSKCKANLAELDRVPDSDMLIETK